MVYVLKIALLILFPNVLCTSDQAPEPAAGSTSIEVAALREQLREESLSLREEMYSLLGDNQSNLLLLQVIDLIKEVKEMQGLVKVQGEKIEGMESKLEEKIEEIESKLEEEFEKMDVKQSESSEKMESKLVETFEDMESRIVDSIDVVETKISENLREVGSKVTKVDSKIEVGRSELRLISQHKLTWQNSTYSEKLFSEYVVDGVYTASGDLWGVNPIQHAGAKQKDFILVIDLGGFFKIHTVKVWNRVDCCQSQCLGVFVYADEELLGGISDEKLIYDFRANDDVYARKIYLKQSIPNWMNLREVQVFGTGPYGEDEA